MIEVIKEILPDISIEVVKTEEFTGISIANIDDKKSCVVQAKLQCDVDMSEDCIGQFSVSVNTLGICMRTVASHYVMDMIKYEGSEDIEIESRDQITNARINSCRMNTLCKDFTKATMNTMDYDYTIQIELSVFRSIVKISKDLHADTLSFVIHETKTGEGAQMKRDIMFCLRAKGDAQHEHYFPSTVSEEDCVITASEENKTEMHLDASNLVYEDKFSVNYLNMFLKSMDRQVLTLRISEGKPLVLMYPLGAEKSFVCFVLASKADDD